MLCELTAMVLLAVASIYDLRERAVPDRLWVIGSALGVAVKLLNYENTLQFISKVWPFLLILLIVLAIEWVFSLSGQADVLAYLTLAALLSGNCMFPDAFSVYVLSKVLIVTIIPLQFFINAVRIAKNPKLIDGFDEPSWRKLVAMMLLSPYDRRLAICASSAEVSVNGKRRFLLKAALRVSCDPVREGMWIAPAYPAMPMILAATSMVILRHLIHS